MACRESPFIYEDAVPADRFFDRRDEINFLVENLRVKRKMLLCIVAPLKYGKSSLMLRYYDILKEIGDIIPIYVNLKKADMPIMLIIEELKKWGINLTKAYQEARELGRLQKLFDEINESLKAGNLWLFLLFDEFHLLPEIIRGEGFYRDISNDSIIFGFFRGFAEGARISYIVCGSVIEPLMRALDVWGGRFELIYLGPFNQKDAVEMLKSLFARGGMKISDEEALIIAESAGFHPFYMQYMGHKIFLAREISRKSIRMAKQKLFEFLIPIFISYLKKIKALGKEYLDTLAKIINGNPLGADDLEIVSDLLRMGIVKPKNAEFEIVDPLFRRYLQQIIRKVKISEVSIVGHWAERIVGNYLVEKGYTPYYSHDSRGAFDIYVRVKGVDAGIQVKYSAEGRIYLSQEEAEKIILSAKENKWRPIIALVGRQIKFFPNIRPGKYTIDQGYQEIEEAIKNTSNYAELSPDLATRHEF